MEKILVVDDNQEIRKQLKWGLGVDYTVLAAGDRKEALSQVKRHHPKVVVLDLGLPPDEDGTSEGFAILESITAEHPLAKVIIMTGNEDRANALKAVQMGAYDFYEKPLDLKELRVILKRAFHLSRIEEENRRLATELRERNQGVGGMVGQCPAMEKVFTTIRKVAPSDASVMIVGESGTGKELVAKAIHSLSLRKEHRFVPISCGAIPETLLESELFGYEKGAFTGAQAQTPGKVEFANRGTLFLDEIGELPGHLQVKLLRFLQERTMQRLGGREDIEVDARFLAATNADLARAIQDGRFREDLYYRISVVTVTLPPLRERGGDTLLLANLFLHRFTEDFGKKVKGFSPGAMEALESYDWPGNVRELENRVQRAVIMSESAVIEPHELGIGELPKSRRAFSWSGLSLKEARERLDRDVVSSAIDRFAGNIAKAAEELGISRPTLYDLMKKHNIQVNGE